jgi:hypothetical protein
MNTTSQKSLIHDLQTYLALCQEVMALASSESLALSGEHEYVPFEFYQKRKNLLPRLEQSLMVLRKWRIRWQEAGSGERAGCSEAKSLFQAVQGLLMKVLLLDRENQQALLKRGLLPAPLLSSTPVQQTHCVANVYRRHSRE